MKNIYRFLEDELYYNFKTKHNNIRFINSSVLYAYYYNKQCSNKMIGSDIRIQSD